VILCSPKVCSFRLAGIVQTSLSAPSPVSKSRAPTVSLATPTKLAAYKDFLTLWRDADPDIPILKEAKAEYAKLQ